MSEDSHDVPARVARALGAEESGELDALVRAARPDDLAALRSVALGEIVVEAPDARTKAVYALGRAGDPTLPEIVDRLGPALDERGRIVAVDALGRIGGETALDTVLRSADDGSEQVRKAVVTALTRIGGDRAARALDRIAEADPAGWIRDLARAATGPSGRSRR